MAAIVHDVVFQHAENACALWLQRQRAVDEPHYVFEDIAHLDARLEANLYGLRTAGIHACAMLDEMIDAGDGGAWFSRAVLALERGEHRFCFEMLDAVAADEDGLEELESALCHVEPARLRGIARELLDSSSSTAVVLGLRTCAAHQRNPGARLEDCARNADATVRAAVSRAAAELGARPFATLLLRAEPDGEHERFERARALAMLGHLAEARCSLSSLALDATPTSGSATALLMLMSASDAGHAVLKELAGVPGRERDVIRGFGLLGDPLAMEWLIERCHEPSTARLAGEAIAMIAGIDLSDENLELDDPPDVESVPNDDPGDTRVALDEDGSLPWPDPERLAAWWSHSAGSLPAGVPKLCGLAREPTGLERVLRDAGQRQRAAAASALAFARPATGYRDTRLPSARQQSWMSELGKSRSAHSR